LANKPGKGFLIPVRIYQPRGHILARVPHQNLAYSSLSSKAATNFLVIHPAVNAGSLSIPRYALLSMYSNSSCQKDYLHVFEQYRHQGISLHPRPAILQKTMLRQAA